MRRDKRTAKIPKPRNCTCLHRFLDDHHSCGNIIRFNAGGQGKQNPTEVFVSDEAVGGLERLTDKRFEKEVTCSLSGVGDATLEGLVE